MADASRTANVTLMLQQWQQLAAFSMRQAEQAAQCERRYIHPKYLVFEALMEVLAADSYFHINDLVDYSRLLERAKSHVALLTQYGHVPGTFRSTIAHIERAIDSLGAGATRKANVG